MTIYIPIIPILFGLWCYLAAGFLLTIPLAAWQNRFISGNRPWAEGIRWIRAVLISCFFWPVVLGYNIKTEIRYRRKGLL